MARKRPDIRIKRVYEDPSPKDGERFLIDGLWPRGVKKEELEYADWVKDVAPSKALRQWFGHDPTKWEEFVARYHAELDDNPDAWQPLLDAARREPITLLYAARDTDHNNAVALRAYLNRMLDC